MLTQETRVSISQFGTFKLDECLKAFVSKKDELSRSLIEEFFDLLTAKHKNKWDVFKNINLAIKSSIESDNFKLAEYTLDYFNECVHKNPYPYGHEVNEDLIDMTVLSKINEAKRWDLIEKILDCSNLSTQNTKKFCFTYFDFKRVSPTTSDSATCCFFIPTYKPLPQHELEPITDLKNHALVMFAESGQRRLKDHPTARKLMQLKWRSLSQWIYWMITLLKLVYLILFSIMADKQFYKHGLEHTKIKEETSLGLLISLLIFSSFNALYEIFQFLGDGWGSYLYSKKNWLELATLILSFIIYIALVGSELTELTLHIIPICVLLKYITFVLCLEKFEIESEKVNFHFQFGIYIVAFGQAFKKSYFSRLSSASCYSRIHHIVSS